MTTNKITSNIMDNISNKLKVQGFSKGEGKALVLVNGSNMDIFKNGEFYQILKTSGYKVSLGFSFMAERLLDSQKIISLVKPEKVYREEDISNLKDILREYSIVIAPNISMNTLTKVSSGMIDSLIPNIIWSFLYFSKKVYIDFNSVRCFMGEKTNNGEINRLIEENIKTLIKMGASELTELHEISKLERKNDTKSTSESNLITEKDISKLDKAQRVLVVNKKTLVTPLAWDKAREIGIKIEKQ